ncbi:MAG: DUF4395 domain-containing protein [Acidimicrobiia bacterium]|nr:DUF4395 domain-containing protein [Acidimicrobiia bacterium]MDH5504053.1 DUF4395 domain-containing protein [Acidimicrobiia bacterium]
MNTVDINIPRVNQAVTALLCLLGFVTSRPAFVAVAFAILVLSRFGGPKVAPVTQLYVRLIRPRLRPDGPTEFEDARPPAFSQLLGTVFLGAALVALGIGATILGWSLTVLVASLAALAATSRICVGCILYERFLMRAAA